MRPVEFVPRIIQGNFNTPEKLKGMIAFCKKAGITQVQLVAVETPYEPAWLPKPQLVRRCRMVRRVIRTLGQHGITGNICVVRTFMPLVGKHDDEPIGFKQLRVDMEGKTSPGCPCPLDPIYQDYIRFFYAQMASTGARELFVDDDFRYERLGTGLTCFCPLHMREFRKRYPKHRATVSSIAAACRDERPTPLKRDWMEFKRVLLIEFARELRETVHSVDPEVRMGLMLTCTEISIFEGRDFTELVQAFAGPHLPLVRPASGCYNDYDRLTFLSGQADTVYQVSQLPRETDAQAEVDMFPHSPFHKTPEVGLDYQVKTNIACNLKKQNIWPFGAWDKVDASHPYTRFLAAKLPDFNAMADAIPDAAVMGGVSLVYSQKVALLKPHRPEQVRMFGPRLPPLLWRLGIAWTFEKGDTVILNKDSFPMPREAVKDLFANRNLLIDIDALLRLRRMGFGKTLGLRSGRVLEIADKVKERLTTSSINGPQAGTELFTWHQGGIVRVLKPVSRAWTVLSHWIDCRKKKSSPAVLARKLEGQRIIVTGYPIASTALAEPKRLHLQALLEWLHGGPLPAAVQGAPDISPVVMKDSASRVTVVSLINASTARAEKFTLTIASTRRGVRVRYLSDTGKLTTVPARCIRRTRNALHVTVPPAAGINPYDVRLFRVEPA